MVKIIIADDHEIVRSGLTLLIERENDLQICAKASSFAQIVPLLEAHRCSLLILDLNLGDRNGLGSLESIYRRFPDLPILVLSSYPDTPYAMQAFKAGASGYLNKAVIGEELIEAIRTVASGKKYISRSLEEVLPYGTELDTADKDTLATLSKRELEVLSLIAEGKAYKEIAATLGVSPKTVSTYRARLLEKLDLENTADLLRFAFEHHLGTT